MRRDDPLAGIDVHGPVQAEVLVVVLRQGVIELTGPCGAAPRYIETPPDEHPVDVVRRIVESAIGDIELIHSTSWRQGSEGVILTFLVVIDVNVTATMESVPVARSALARSGPTAAPAAVETQQVTEHAIRHLAWLVEDDAVVASRLSQAWREVLRSYIPEPFRNLG